MVNSFIRGFLADAKGSFTKTPIEFDLVCTATEQRTCQIVPRVSIWNEVLCHVRLELVEVSGEQGQLALAATNERCLPTPTKHEWAQATALVCRLLMKHSCVASVDISCLDVDGKLICGAFWANSSIKRVKFDSRSFKVCQNIFTFVALLGNVEELECTSSLDCAHDCLVGALGSLLRCTTSLRSLKLPTLRLEEEGASRFVENLRANSAIKEIWVHDSITECSTFMEYLQSATHLASLSVSPGFSQRCWTLKRVLAGLVENKNITDIRLERFMVEREGAELIFKVLAMNPGLRTFYVTSSMGCFLTEPSANYCFWVAALAENRPLQEVTLPMGILKPQEWDVVFKALSANESISRVTLQVDDILEQSAPREICHLIRERGVERKVLLGPCCPDINVLSCKASTEALIWLRFFQDINRALGVLRSLPFFGHITSLNVQVDASCLRKEVVSAIADYMSSTDTLQTLSLECCGEGTGDYWKAIVQSLSENASVRKLELVANRVYPENVELLADLVNASRTISELDFNVFDTGEVETFVRRLSEAVRQNYTLLKIHLHAEFRKSNAVNWFTVSDTARRNSGLVALPAQFVTGMRRDRYCAQALELVSSHFALLDEITKLTSTTESEASAMVRKGLKDISSMLAFMQTAGVVKRRLECHRRDDGRLQLDDLNEYCQQLVRTYLKISDVRGTV